MKTLRNIISFSLVSLILTQPVMHAGKGSFEIPDIEVGQKTQGFFNNAINRIGEIVAGFTKGINKSTQDVTDAVHAVTKVGVEPTKYIYNSVKELNPTLDYAANAVNHVSNTAQNLIDKGIGLNIESFKNVGVIATGLAASFAGICIAYSGATKIFKADENLQEDIGWGAYLKNKLKNKLPAIVQTGVGIMTTVAGLITICNSEKIVKKLTF